MHEILDDRLTTRICDVFHSANQRGCSYELSAVTLTTAVHVSRPTPWHAAIVPPMERWMGLSQTDAAVSRLADVLSEAHIVVGIGTGVFLLAATGFLNDRDVVVEPSLARFLTACVPSAHVHCGVAALRDGDVMTVADPNGVESVCSALIESDYERAAPVPPGCSERRSNDVHTVRG